MSSPQPMKKSKLIITIIYPEKNKPTHLMIELKGLYGDFTASKARFFSVLIFFKISFFLLLFFSVPNIY